MWTVGNRTLVRSSKTLLSWEQLWPRRQVQPAGGWVSVTCSRFWSGLAFKCFVSSITGVKRKIELFCLVCRKKNHNQLRTRSRSCELRCFVLILVSTTSNKVLRSYSMPVPWGLKWARTQETGPLHLCFPHRWLRLLVSNPCSLGNTIHYSEFQVEKTETFPLVSPGSTIAAGKC